MGRVSGVQAPARGGRLEREPATIGRAPSIATGQREHAASLSPIPLLGSYYQLAGEAL
jgi:hypothetical protein